MEKKFCDICEAPAENDLHKIEIKEPLGEPYQAYKSDTGGGISGTHGIWQCKIVVKPVITFEHHRTGFGGPPDLCRACVVNLLLQLADASRPKPEAVYEQAFSPNVRH